eukprot:3771542-Heterocapsa_arctica.AAC.1
MALLVPGQRDSVVPPVQLRGSNSTHWPPCGEPHEGRAAFKRPPEGSRLPSGGQLRVRHPGFRELDSSKEL